MAPNHVPAQYRHFTEELEDGINIEIPWGLANVLRRCCLCVLQLCGPE